MPYHNNGKLVEHFITLLTMKHMIHIFKVGRILHNYLGPSCLSIDW